MQAENLNIYSIHIEFDIFNQLRKLCSLTVLPYPSGLPTPNITSYFQWHSSWQNLFLKFSAVVPRPKAPHYKIFGCMWRRCEWNRKNTVDLNEMVHIFRFCFYGSTTDENSACVSVFSVEVEEGGTASRHCNVTEGLLGPNFGYLPPNYV